MNNLQNKIKDKIFLVTSELNPPKGTDLSTLFNKVELLKKSITAFNITDNHTSKMSMSPIAVANLLKTQEIEPIVQLACRDKNRVALQSDILGLSALGIKNILCMTGDHSSIGDDPNSKPVFDLDGISLLKAVSSLRNGKDLANNKLKGAPEIFSGAVANPGSNDIQKEIDRMKQKIEAGAQFFQTQPVYDIKKFESFFNQTKELNIPIIAGHIMLKSADMANNFNKNIPGVSIPQSIIKNLSEASDKKSKSSNIAIELINELKNMCQGIHLMALGWESLIPNILKETEIKSNL
ncbi:MAG: 5,10-methylenetetrahydrofolate reductase [Chloroflexi bacterium]|nr:5,10-methylenetetrahydrofolate reductase [Chloroflexota bacterium]|tara:strand:- start:5157 stop:6038 length:882 start_codon:yes stop_codon:yes gene_type:complete